LYLGVLVRKVAPEHEVVVYERNRPDDTFGFGVVFSDATLGALAAADAESHEQITSRFARWDDLSIHHKGAIVRSSGHGFCGLERKQLLHILQRRAAELGVVTHFERDVRSLDDPALAGADLIVAADGVGSWVRDALADQLRPSVELGPNKFVWLGTTLPYEAFTFDFVTSPHGMFRVHAYRYTEGASTFIAECTDATWRAHGLDQADEDRTIAILSEVFAVHLRGHRFVKNRSIWRNFPTVRCGSWRAKHAGRDVVLVGDAAHTAHFSIGSGTKLAMEDVIALRDALLATPGDVTGALARYEAKRRPEVEALQAAAAASRTWFEHTERYIDLATPQFVYHLLTRSLRVSHKSIARRDPGLAWSVEMLLAGRAAVEPAPDETRPRRPAALPIVVGGLHLVNRVAVIPETAPSKAPAVAGDLQLVDLGGAARAGAGLVLAPIDHAGGAAIGSDDQVTAWRRIVDFVHTRSPARIGAIVAAWRDAITVVGDARRIAAAGFDLLVLDLGAEGAGAAHAAGIHAGWTPERPLAIRVAAIDPERAFDAVRRALIAKPALCWVASTGDDHAAVLLAERIRLELAVPTAIGLSSPAGIDRDAIIAAGRADLIVAGRVPDEVRTT
jgi:anthraniloyl-CoA monooxygenase